MSDREFDPRQILSSLQGNMVLNVVIGGLARVLRGSDEVTTGVDVCPSLQRQSVARLAKALEKMEAVRPDGRELIVDVDTLQAEPVMELSTAFGELKLVPTPAGVPRGFDALRAGGSAEHLGMGLRPEIASTRDLITMSAALRRDHDLERIPALRRILEFEADPASLVGIPEPSNPRYRPSLDVARQGLGLGSRSLGGRKLGL